MNTQINPRTFTDQIPAYYEKTRFLQELGRGDLADIHDYFFYKRLLLFYNQLKEMESPEKEDYLQEIRDILIKDKKRVLKAFACPQADKRDYKKAVLFLQSPDRYWRKIQWENQVVIPLKVKVKAMLRR